ncbi:MAG TPA: helix-turn-helix domain-containing protein [Acidimicrobiales bacterium]
MNAAVNPRRAYDSSRRREQARRTRLAVLDAARRLFLDRGYAGTTVAAVAGEAGTSVETVYKAFGNKPGLVKAVFDVAIVGDDEPVPLMDREFVQRNMAEPDPRVKLTAYGRHLAGVSVRANPIQLVVRDAAIADAGAADVWRQLLEERLTGMTAFATHLAEGGHLRDGVDVDEARDVLWTYTSVDVWDLLVNHRGWPADRYGAWVGRQLVAALL